MAAHESRIIRNEVVLRKLEVISTTQLTPCMKRVVLGGEALRGFHSPSPDDHVKVFLPNEDGELVIPALGANGLEHTPGARPSPMRDYTPRHHDVAANTLAVDFVLHGHGPAAAWATKVKPGDPLAIGGPRGSHVVADDFDHYVLVGDETALPAMGRWIESSNGRAPITALIEIPDQADRQSLPTAANVAITWLPRNGGDAAASGLLEQALRELPVPAGDTFYWIAAESRRARAMRQYLSDQRGVAKDWMRATGYWKADPNDAD